MGPFSHTDTREHISELWIYVHKLAFLSDCKPKEIMKTSFGSISYKRDCLIPLKSLPLKSLEHSLLCRLFPFLQCSLPLIER